MTDWRSYKQAAALLDFDDLLYKARDLLAGHEEVRQALARRFRHVLVDEFQDTDPLQIEILWQLCGESSGSGSVDPLARALRQKALFLVGDPKQAIYRFRGADVNAYIGARTAIGDAGLLKITANFRSVEPILRFVNDQFEAPLSAAAGQPGFTELSPTCDAEPGVVSVAALDIADGEDAKADTIRDAEAKCVADLCIRLDWVTSPSWPRWAPSFGGLKRRQGRIFPVRPRTSRLPMADRHSDQHDGFAKGREAGLIQDRRSGREPPRGNG